VYICMYVHMYVQWAKERNETDGQIAENIATYVCSSKWRRSSHPYRNITNNTFCSFQNIFKSVHFSQMQIVTIHIKFQTTAV
jgi:hypothetical protein